MSDWPADRYGPKKRKLTKKSKNALVVTTNTQSSSSIFRPVSDFIFIFYVLYFFHGKYILPAELCRLTSWQAARGNRWPVGFRVYGLGSAAKCQWTCSAKLARARHKHATSAVQAWGGGAVDRETPKKKKHWELGARTARVQCSFSQTGMKR